jgi:hypothetical protein
MRREPRRNRLLSPVFPSYSFKRSCRNSLYRGFHVKYKKSFRPRVSRSFLPLTHKSTGTLSQVERLFSRNYDKNHSPCTTLFLLIDRFRVGHLPMPPSDTPPHGLKVGAKNGNSRDNLEIIHPSSEVIDDSARCFVWMSFAQSLQPLLSAHPAT